MASIVSIQGVAKTYDSGVEALGKVDLEIQRGEIFALLGPNGAGKTTLINIVCGIVTMSQGRVIADGHDIVTDFRGARSKIGLVPQELSTDAFESVWSTVTFSRGLFGKRKNPAHVEKVLRELSLWDKRDAKIMTLSGGMKRRVLIAKALSHEPTILFLDEPTAGVDVELRHDMWNMVRELRANGVTIILTTHYIEEAEEMADRIGVIAKGRLVVVEDKHTLMRRLGKRQLSLVLQHPLERIPESIARPELELARDGTVLTYTFDIQGDQTGIAPLLKQLGELGIDFKDLHSRETSLEEIFVDLVDGGKRVNLPAIRAIYRFEMARAFRTWMQSILSPVLSTSLYFVVFGSAIGSRMGTVEGVDYGSFIIPGLVMLSLLGESDLERVVRHLPAEVVGHDLRAAVVAGVVRRGRDRLRRSGRLEVADARRADPRDRARVRAVPRSFIRSGWSRSSCSPRSRSACSASSSGSGPTASRSCRRSR